MVDVINKRRDTKKSQKRKISLSNYNAWIIYYKPHRPLFLKDKDNNWVKRVNCLKLGDIDKKRYGHLYTNMKPLKIDEFKIGIGIFYPPRNGKIEDQTNEWLKHKILCRFVNHNKLTKVAINITKEFDHFQEKLRDDFIEASKYGMMMNSADITNFKNNWDCRQYFVNGHGDNLL